MLIENAVLTANASKFRSVLGRLRADSRILNWGVILKNQMTKYIRDKFTPCSKILRNIPSEGSGIGGVYGSGDGDFRFGEACHKSQKIKFENYNVIIFKTLHGNHFRFFRSSIKEMRFCSAIKLSVI